MLKTKLVFIITLFVLIHPGCLARYGEGRLNSLLSSINGLEKECMINGEVLTADKVKERLGRPGHIKPIYESIPGQHYVEKLKQDSGVLLKPNYEDLYDVLSGNKGEKPKDVKLLSYVYDRMGQDETSLTFYLRSDEERGNDGSIVIGWDYVEYGSKNGHNGRSEEGAFINYKINGPADFLRLPYTFLIDTVIGLKQFAGEIIKSPVSFVEAEILKNMLAEKKVPFYKLDGFKAAIEDWRNGFTALTYRYRVDGKQDTLEVTQNLLGEVPVIGPLFDQWCTRDSCIAKKVFLTRGIYGGDNSAQNTALWSSFLTNPEVQLPDGQECISGYSERKSENINNQETCQAGTNVDDNLCVKAVPYRYGSMIDVVWSLLNISHGYAYDMASEIVLNYDINPGDFIQLQGHSGGVQRVLSTSRILNDDGISVEEIFGIAGPALGHAPCSKIKVVLNGKINEDFISDMSRLLNYLTLNLLTNIEWEYKKDVDEVYKHRTPGFVDGRTRLKYDGFLEDYKYNDR